METVTLEEASAHLAGLVDWVEQGGEESVITRDNRPVAKRVALPANRELLVVAVRTPPNRAAVVDAAISTALPPEPERPTPNSSAPHEASF